MATSVHVIGSSYFYEFGYDAGFQTKALSKCEISTKSANINQIICGDWFNIYLDKDENIWTAGSNGYGQCATNYLGKIKNDGFHQLKYFKNKNIKIKKICTNIRAKHVFWITTSNKVYANGRNDSNQLGITNSAHSNHQPTPILIFDNILQQDIDIQPGKDFSIVLWSNLSPIFIRHWCRISKIKMPNEIINIMQKFYNFSKVLSVGNSDHGAHGHRRELLTEWTESDGLKGKNIVKMRVMGENSFFIDSAGTVWCCGKNQTGNLGLGHFKCVWDVECISSLAESGVRIKDIECGDEFTVMIDCDGKVWVCGSNEFGQLGYEENYALMNTPTELKVFTGCNVGMVRCGSYHCYLRCDSDKHYLWGSNQQNVCLVFDDDINYVSTPKMIELNGMTVKDVFLGNGNTKVIVSSD